MTGARSMRGGSNSAGRADAHTSLAGVGFSPRGRRRRARLSRHSTKTPIDRLRATHGPNLEPRSRGRGAAHAPRIREGHGLPALLRERVAPNPRGEREVLGANDGSGRGRDPSHRVYLAPQARVSALVGRGGRRSRGVCGGARGPFIARAADGLATFCRFWRMTPREVDELTSDEFDAF